MADLLDIAPSTAVEVVKINGEPLTVHSLGSNDIASLAKRFPFVFGVFLGGGINIADNGPRFVAQFGEATGPIIAAGCGHLADEKYEHYAGTAFLLEDQLKMVTAIIGITFPNGFGFFEELVKRVKRLTGEAVEEAKGHKIRLRQSPSASPPLSGEASPPNMQ